MNQENANRLRELYPIHIPLDVAAQYLAVSPRRLSQLIADKRHPFASIGANIGTTQKYVRVYIDKLKSFIDANYMQPLRVEDLARQLSLDRRYLSRRFKQQTGLTLQEHIIQVRLQKGVQYLQQGYSVGDAAKMCGYDSCANFSRMFRRRYGKSPTESIK